MGATRRYYGVTLILVGITSFPFTTPTIGAASVSFGSIISGIVMIFS